MLMIAMIKIFHLIHYFEGEWLISYFQFTRLDAFSDKKTFIENEITS